MANESGTEASEEIASIELSSSDNSYVTVRRADLENVLRMIAELKKEIELVRGK
jgi:hypothetical protein